MTFSDAQEFAESVIFRSVTGKLICSGEYSLDIWNCDKESSSLYDLIDNISNSIEKHRNEVLDFEVIESPESRGIHYGDENFYEEFEKYDCNQDKLSEIIQKIFDKLVLIRHASNSTLKLLYHELVEFYESH